MRRVTAIVALLYAVALGFVPGALVTRALVPDDEPAAVRAAFALLLSPFIVGALFILARAWLAPSPAARAVVVLIAAGSVIGGFAHRGRPAFLDRDWIPIAAGLALAIAHAVSPALTSSSDGSFHAGVVTSALRGLPPEDPFFAGLQLRYAWGLHAWAAAWVAVGPRIDPWTPLIASSALALIASLLAVGALARRLGASAGGARLAQAFLLVGTAPFAWVTLVARAATGTVRGGAELARSLEHGVDPALRALDPGLLHPSLVLALDKFVVLTPFAWAMAGAIGTAWALVRVLERPGPRAYVALGLAIAATGFVHPLAGAVLAVACSVGARMAPALAAGRGQMPYLLLALVVAGATTIPWLVVSAPQPTGTMQTDTSTFVTAAWSTLAAGAFLLPPTLFGGGLPGWTVRHAKPAPALVPLRALQGMTWLFVALACLVRLPGANQSKFLDLALALAAAPAACAWMRALESRRWRGIAVAVLTLAFVPTLLAYGWACAHESPASADAPSMPPAGILAAIRERTPPDAVIIDATQDTSRGAASGIPAATGRALLWGGPFMARKWGYPLRDLELRRETDAAGRHGRRGYAPAPVTESRSAWIITWGDSTRDAESLWQVFARDGGVVLGSWR